jgi:hypothetical protein
MDSPLTRFLSSVVKPALAFVLCVFVATAAVAEQDGGAGILPRPGLYRTAGSGITFELSAISPSSMRVRQWQTATPEPPESRGAYYNAGTATLLGDGVTWRSHNRDAAGYCCGNNVELEFQILSPTSFKGIRYRMWPLTGAAPGAGDLWQPTGADELRLVGELAVPPASGGPPPPSPAPPYPAAAPPERPGLVDSGARFSSLSGQIEIYHDGQSPKDATYVKMDTVIYEGDHIITGEDSSAIIGFGDMSTFLLKGEAEIIVTTPPAKDSKIGLVAGNIWVNVKKMMKNGTMEVDMSQAVCGIKGTTLVLETNPVSSTIKVIEGSVEVASKSGPRSVKLDAGYMVTATAAGLGPVVSYSTSAETASWQSLLSAATGYGGAADRAVDGNTNGDYFAGRSVTHTEEDNQPQPWWQVDLGVSSRIDHVMLWNRRDCCGERLASFWVFVSDSPFPAGDVSALLADGRIWRHEHGGAAGPQTRIAVGRRGRYIRVQLSGRAPLSLAEVEVFGR